MTVVTAAATTGVLVVAAPGLGAILDLPIAVPLLIAASTAAVVVASRYLGHFQGTERFGWLAAGLLLLAVGRYGGVIFALWAGSGLTGALATGAAIAWLVAGVLVLVDRIPRSTPISVGEPVLVRTRQVLGAGGATLAMLVIASTDLVLARAVLGAEESGAYAVGSVLTKGALWAPQVVTVLVLPRLARGRAGALTLAIALVAASGVALTGAAAFAGRFAMGLAGGAQYQYLGGYAVGFAAVGALYAVVFVLVNAEIAAGDRWPALSLWFAAAGLTVAVFLLPRPTVPAILIASIVTATAATALTALIAARRHRAARRARLADESTVPLVAPPA
jgi:O-antigen/teichoic acid export membrane protein